VFVCVGVGERALVPPLVDVVDERTDEWSEDSVFVVVVGVGEDVRARIVGIERGPGGGPRDALILAVNFWRAICNAICLSV
jgi:hypothetical protein